MCSLSSSFLVVEVGPWCNGKCFLLKAIGCGFESRNYTLQNKLGVRLLTMTSFGPLKKWEFCTLGTTFYLQVITGFFLGGGGGDELPHAHMACT